MGRPRFVKRACVNFGSDTFVYLDFIVSRLLFFLKKIAKMINVFSKEDQMNTRP